MGIDLLGPEPLYLQIAAVLGRRIDDGTYQPNRAIPSQAAICAEFGVSRKTAIAAVRVLTEQGRVFPVRARGVFVTPPADG